MEKNEMKMTMLVCLSLFSSAFGSPCSVITQVDSQVNSQVDIGGSTGLTSLCGDLDGQICTFGSATFCMYKTAAKTTYNDSGCAGYPLTKYTGLTIEILPPWSYLMRFQTICSDIKLPQEPVWFGQLNNGTCLLNRETDDEISKMPHGDCDDDAYHFFCLVTLPK